jgi:hypothetical protein
MTVSPNWTPPPPEPAGETRRPIRTGRLWAGIGVTMAAHLLTIIIGWGSAFLISGEPAVTFLLIVGIGQLLLAIAAVTYGIVQTVRARDGGVGAGVIIGWAIGLIISPFIGFGVCVSLVNSDSGGMFG